MNLTQCTDSQHLVVTTLDGPLMVSAGAGSGKTFTLTQRVAYALTSHDGQPPFLDSVDDLLAITFTTKAAEELRSRIKGLLLDEGLVEDALRTDDAWVSTIHGMASRILREYALEIGVDPAFEVIDDSESDELMDLALERVVQQVRDGDDPGLSEFFRSEKLRGSSRNDKGVVDYAGEVFNRVHAMPDGFDSLVVEADAESPTALMRRLEAAAVEMAELVPFVKKPGKSIAKFLDKLNGALEKIKAWLASPQGLSGISFADEEFDSEAFCEAFYSVPPTTGSTIQGYEELFESWWKTLVELDVRVRAALSQRWRDAVIQVAHLVEEAYQDLKGPGRLDNTDLLLRCSRALREHPAIAEGLRRKFKLIMVDEFQDTDRLQVDIISRLAQPGLSNVCTVGDAQQSIYRFRGADVNVFTEYRRNLERTTSKDAVVPMAKNFRSHGDILAFVEHIFSQREVFGYDFLKLEAGGAVSKQPDPLFAERPRVQVDVVHGETRKASVNDARRASAAAIARHFAALRAEGASVGDMVILLGGMTHAGLYAEALRAEGIASMITGGSVFSSMPEPQLVLNLLRVAVNSADEEALYPVLVSPLFAVGDDALLALASCPTDRGEWRHRSLARGFAAADLEENLLACGLPDEHVKAVASCRTLLRAFADRAQRTSCEEALRRLLVDSGLLDRLQNDGVEGLASAANFAKAVCLVGQLEVSATGVASTAAAFESHLATAKEAPGALATASDDFVRIMTVHASKGLEFPHVAVAELRHGREGAGRLVVENVGQHTYASAAFMPVTEWEGASDKFKGLAGKLDDDEVFDVTSVEPEQLDDALERLGAASAHQALARFAVDQALAEARRLLYVALTRASKSLFVAVVLGSNPSKGYEDKGVVSDLYHGLAWDTAGARAITMVDYGGSAPARVTVTALGQLADEAAEAEGQNHEEETASQVRHEKSSASVEPFVVSVRDIPPAPLMMPCGFAHANLFSYSSISGTHEHADQPIDAAKGEGIEVVADAEESAMEENLIPCSPSGEDATALGRAFHRLAQQAIERSADEALFVPSEAAVKAQIQKEQLSANQQERLRVALDRWLGSDEAVRFASFENHSAEVPFTVQIPASRSGVVVSDASPDAIPIDASPHVVPSDASPHVIPIDASPDVIPSGARSTESKDLADGMFFLEGEIDGLADNGDGAAFLIDYKTGGHDDETPEQLDAKHRLQASCYAYALMRAGYTSVEAHFLRIEHPSPENSRDPQIVPYHFESADLPALEALIIGKQQEAVA